MALLHEFQIRELLRLCEAALGERLSSVRGQLAQGDADAATWELLVMDAVLQHAQVEYERRTLGGGTPDLWVETPDRVGMWLEAAYVHKRPQRLIKRRDALIRRFYKEARQRNIPVGFVSFRIEGLRTPLGYEPRLPAEHTFPSFFGLDPVREFFRRARELPQDQFMCDLDDYGFDVKFFYCWSDSVPATTSGSYPVIEAPREINDHIVFLKLQEKARKYKRQVDQPFVVCLGSAESDIFDRFDQRFVRRQDAALAALDRYPVLSAVLLVAITTDPVNRIRLPGVVTTSALIGRDWQRVAHCELFVNRRASTSLSRSMDAILKQLDLNKWDYGSANFADWSVALPGRERRSLYAARQLVRHGGSKMEVELPAVALAQLICGDVTPERFASTSGEVVPNLVSKALDEGREIVSIDLIPADPRARQAARVRVAFGPPQAPLVRTAK